MGLFRKLAYRAADSALLKRKIIQLKDSTLDENRAALDYSDNALHFKVSNETLDIDNESLIVSAYKAKNYYAQKILLEKADFLISLPYIKFLSKNAPQRSLEWQTFKLSGSSYSDESYISAVFKTIELNDIGACATLFNPHLATLNKGRLELLKKKIIDTGRPESLLVLFNAHPDIIPYLLESIPDNFLEKIITQSWASHLFFSQFGDSNLLHKIINKKDFVTLLKVASNLKFNTQINQCDSKGRTPLMALSQYKDIGLIKDFIQKTNGLRDISSTDKEGRNIFHYAAILGFRELLDYLLENCPNSYELITKTDINGLCPLNYSLNYTDSSLELQNEKIACCLSLLRHSRQDSILANYGQAGSILNQCIITGNKTIFVEALLKINDAYCFSKKDSNGQTALELTASLNLPHFGEMINERIKSLAIILKKVQHQTTFKDWPDDLLAFKYIESADLEKFEAYLEEKDNKAETVKDNEGNNLLIYSARLNKTAFVEKLLKHGFDPNYQNSKGESALLWASCWGSYESAKILIDNNADLELPDDKGTTPFIGAAQNDHPLLITLLYQSGANALSRNNEQETAAMWAAANGNYNSLNAIITAERDLVNIGAELWFPIILAADRGHSSCIGLLAMAGANLETKSYYDQTSLHISIIKKHFETTERLILLGADINAIDKEGFAPLFYAIENKDLDTVKLLLKHKVNMHIKNNDGQDAFLFACSCGTPEILQHLIDAGANYKTKDNDGNGALHLAAESNPESLRLLIDLELGLDEQNNFKLTPLYLAVRANAFDSTKLLLEKGAKTDISQKNGLTPLHRAAGLGYDAIIDILNAYHADIHAEDENGRTPIFSTVYGNKLSSFIKLAQLGSYLWKTDKNNTTLLMVSAMHDAIDITNELLKRHQDKNKRDVNGHDATMLAALNGSINSLKALVAAKVDLSQVDDNGCTALNLANNYNQPITAKYLYEITKDSIGVSAKTPLLPKIEYLRIPEETRFSNDIVLEILSNLLIACRTAEIEEKLDPNKFLERVLKETKPLSTNIPFYDQKFYKVIQGFSKEYERALQADPSDWKGYLSKRSPTSLISHVLSTSALDLVRSFSAKLAHLNPTNHLRIEGDPFTSAPCTEGQNHALLFLYNRLRMLVANGFESNIASTLSAHTLEKIKDTLKEKNGANVLKEQARYSYPLSNTETCAEFILHSAASKNIDFLDDGKQSAFLYASKKNRPDLMLAMAIGRQLRAGSFTDSIRQKDLDEALFWGVFHGNLTTTKLCLELGANIHAKPVLHDISSSDLAIHLDYKEIVCLFAEKEGKSNEYFINKEINSIKQRYADIVGILLRATLKSDFDKAQSYAQQFFSRLYNGKYIKKELREYLYKTDRIKLKSIDATHDIFFDDKVIPEIDDLSVMQMQAKGIEIYLPSFDKSLVSDQDIEQIYQELIISNILGQKPSLSIEQGNHDHMGSLTELPEALKDTLTGEVLIYTDHVMKDFTRNSLIFTPNQLLEVEHSWQNSFEGETGADYDFYYIGENSSAEERAKSAYKNLTNHGAVDSELKTKLNSELAVIYAKFMKEKGYVKTGGMSGRWMNCNRDLRYSGNKIFCSQEYRLQKDESYYDKNDKESEYNDDHELPSAKFITENIATIPEFARHFELLKVIYSLQPIAEIAVAHHALPDFGQMQLPSELRTPKILPAAFNIDIKKSPDNAEKTSESIFIDLKENKFQHTSLGIGTSYTPTSEARKECPEFFNKGQALIERIINSIDEAKSKGARVYLNGDGNITVEYTNDVKIRLDVLGKHPRSHAILKGAHFHYQKWNFDIQDWDDINEHRNSFKKT